MDSQITGNRKLGSSGYSDMNTLQFICLVIVWFIVGCIISALTGCATIDLNLSAEEINNINFSTAIFYK